jgi:hypothetical protein
MSRQINFMGLLCAGWSLPLLRALEAPGRHWACFSREFEVEFNI